MKGRVRPTPVNVSIITISTLNWTGTAVKFL